ncbi:MAG: TRAP transporter small permease subunit [Spirochaetales bacterium]|nr:TRAP transporter small permease subunit [Spirochaetales bacterium]
MSDIQLEAGASRPKRVIHTLYKSLVHLQTTLLAVLLVLVTLQILARLIPFMPHMLWTEEIARFVLIWMIFLGAAIGVRENTHFTVSLVQEPDSKIGAGIWELLIALGVFVFAAIFSYRGYKYAMGMFWDISDIAQISMFWVGSAIPVFGLLALIFILESVVSQIKKMRA